jgi:hypothetical protein
LILVDFHSSWMMRRMSVNHCRPSESIQYGEGNLAQARYPRQSWHLVP